jgi:tRNA-modifying protein YgfZ
MDATSLMSPTDPEAWAAYTEGRVPAVVQRDVVDVEGADSVKFLQALVSQDVVAMVDGETRWSFLLQPQGKLVAHFRIHRISAERFVLDTDPGVGETLHDSLRRYLIRTKCTLALREDVRVLRFCGNGAASGSVPDAGRSVPAHPLLDAIDVFDTPASTDASSDAATQNVVGAEMAEAHRVMAGVPAHGSELDEATIPNATGLLTTAVNCTKGCYVGQELVERIDARSGAAPTRLVRFEVLTHTGSVPLPIRLGDSGRSLGTVTSLAINPATTTTFGLGYVARSVERGERLLSAEVDGSEPRLTVRVLDDVGGGRP